MRLVTLTFICAIAACREPAGGLPGDSGISADARPTRDGSIADSPALDTSTPDALPDAPPDAAPITGDALQLNDVSVLFPLPTTLAERDTGLLAASSAGSRGELLPASVYDAVGRLLALSSERPRSELRVVAMRLDPCFAVTSPDPQGAGCAAQLRLVLQPIDSSPSVLTGQLGAFDAAVHTFHALTRAEAFAMKQALVDLRLANSIGQHLGPLAPHPLLVTQGLTGAFGTGLRALILDAAGASNLTRVAIMSSVSTAFWRFSIFDVSDATAGTVTVRDIITLPSGTTEQSITAFNPNLPEVGVNPAPVSPTFVDVLSATLAADLSPQARATQFDALIASENPRLSTPETVACASCHAAMIGRALLLEPVYGLEAAASPSAFVATGLAPSQLRPTFTAPAAEFNVHAFSYNGIDPAIIQRTVNETALVVEYFNSAVR